MDADHRHQIYKERVFEFVEIISRQNDWSNGISRKLKDKDGFLFSENQSQLYRLTSPLRFDYYFQLRMQLHY